MKGIGRVSERVVSAAIAQLFAHIEASDNLSSPAARGCEASLLP